MTETVEEFLARGGKVQQLPPDNRHKPAHLNERAREKFNKHARFNCKCGCDGDYTEHRMRMGEKGQL